MEAVKRPIINSSALSMEYTCWTRDSNLRAICRASVSVGMQIVHFALHQSLRRGPRHQHLAERHQRRSKETWAMPTLSRNWPLCAAR